MILLLAARAQSDWLSLLAGILSFVGFSLPICFLVVAFDERKKKPAEARRLARAAMVGAVVAVGVSVGGPLLVIEDPEAGAFYLGLVAPIIALSQSVVFCLAWVQSREPRASRPSDD